MADFYKKQGKKVLLAAADTFRAGATEQLVEWAKRDQVDIVTGKGSSDPAAVVFDGVKKAIDGDYDILFVDTAGRLQNNENLMRELEKMKKNYYASATNCTAGSFAGFRCDDWPKCTPAGTLV